MSCEHCPFKGGSKVVLVGNPNVGKTSIFNMLSGKYEDVSNYPGTSFDVARARIHGCELIDTPGVYGFTNESQLEKMTMEYAKRADVVVNVVSAVTLDRDLVLTEQLMGMGVQLILVVNQIDEAARKGIAIDYERLSNYLNVDIVKTVATKNVGKREVLLAIKNRIRSLPCHFGGNISARKIDDECVFRYENRSDFSQKIDEFLLKPSIGWPVAMVVLCALFLLLGVVVSGCIVDWVLAAMDRVYIPTVTKYVSLWIGQNLLSEIFAGEFGILTMEVKMIFGILLPLIIGFYAVMSLLEDTGYIPRLAVLSNKLFNFFGLNGDAVIPILLGFGCGAMGTISTRILRTKKEKIIATAMIGIAIPCSAQQGIIIALLASSSGIWAWFTYVFTLLIVMVVSGKILSLFLKEQKSDFVMELPPLRLPSFKNCYRKTAHRTTCFLWESLGVFTVSSVIITLLHSYGFLFWLQLRLAPIVETLLHLPRKFSDIFVMGIVRRDFASVGIFDMAREALSGVQILTATVVISLFVPCINALIVIWKERGWQMACALWMGTFAISIAVGSVLTRILEIF